MEFNESNLEIFNGLKRIKELKAEILEEDAHIDAEIAYKKEKMNSDSEEMDKENDENQKELEKYERLAQNMSNTIVFPEILIKISEIKGKIEKYNERKHSIYDPEYEEAHYIDKTNLYRRKKALVEEYDKTVKKIDSFYENKIKALSKEVTELAKYESNVEESLDDLEQRNNIINSFIGDSNELESTSDYEVALKEIELRKNELLEELVRLDSERTYIKDLISNPDKFDREINELLKITKNEKRPEILEQDCNISNIRKSLSELKNNKSVKDFKEIEQRENAITKLKNDIDNALLLMEQKYNQYPNFESIKNELLKAREDLNKYRVNNALACSGSIKNNGDTILKLYEENKPELKKIKEFVNKCNQTLKAESKIYKEQNNLKTWTINKGTKNLEDYIGKLNEVLNRQKQLVIGNKVSISKDGTEYENIKYKRKEIKRLAKSPQARDLELCDLYSKKGQVDFKRLDYFASRVFKIRDKLNPYIIEAMKNDTFSQEDVEKYVKALEENKPLEGISIIYNEKEYNKKGLKHFVKALFGHSVNRTERKLINNFAKIDLSNGIAIKGDKTAIPLPKGQENTNFRNFRESLKEVVKHPITNSKRAIRGAKTKIGQFASDLLRSKIKSFHLTSERGEEVEK